MVKKNKTLLIFGGTFDPPHRAHVELPRLAMQALNADGVIYLPAGRSPHKREHAQSAPHHRLAMLERALADQPWATIDARETERGDTPTFTVDTLEALAAEHPDAQLHLLIGTDQLLAFHQWHRFRDIERLAEPRVMLRPPDTTESVLAKLPSALSAETWKARLLSLPPIHLAATHLRQQIAHGKQPDDLHSEVLAYIQQHRLYTLEHFL